MKIERSDDSMTIQATEDITATNVEELRQSLLNQINDSTKEITINLKEVMLIDSSGISLLISIQNSLKSPGLTLINTSDDLKRMFKLMRLDRHFTVC